jgi:hypothetical protein
MARSGALTMFIVTGITAFTRTTLEGGVVVALAALAGSLVVVGVVTGSGNVAGTRFDRRLERVLPVVNDWTMALLGPGLVAIGALLVVSGIWTGLVSAIIGAGSPGRGGAASPTGGAGRAAPDAGSDAVRVGKPPDRAYGR